MGKRNGKSLVKFWRQHPTYIKSKCEGKKEKKSLCSHIRELLLKLPWTPAQAS